MQGHNPGLSSLPADPLQASIDEVNRALLRSGLPFGAKAAEPRSIGEYPFHHDAKNTKLLWDVRKVGGGYRCHVVRTAMY